MLDGVQVRLDNTNLQFWVWIYRSLYILKRYSVKLTKHFYIMTWIGYHIHIEWIIGNIICRIFSLYDSSIVVITIRT